MRSGKPIWESEWNGEIGMRNAEFGYVISDLGFGIADLQDGFLRFYLFKPLVKPNKPSQFHLRTYLYK